MGLTFLEHPTLLLRFTFLFFYVSLFSLFACSTGSSQAQGVEIGCTSLIKGGAADGERRGGFGSDRVEDGDGEGLSQDGQGGDCVERGHGGSVQEVQVCAGVRRCHCHP